MFQSKDLFDFNNDPILNFQHLYDEHKKRSSIDPTAMTLSTVDEKGHPNARIVLLKQIKDGDFIFYTNYKSTKARELNHQPLAALVFYWHELFVQVRVIGTVSKTTRAESEAYFKTRPHLSQIGALVSEQSEVIESYEHLQNKFDAAIQKYNGQSEISCPENWGGYRVSPQLMEFWFGMEGRLHQRFVYERSGNDWLRTMKSP